MYTHSILVVLDFIIFA